MSLFEAMRGIVRRCSSCHKLFKQLRKIHVPKDGKVHNEFYCKHCFKRIFINPQKEADRFRKELRKQGLASQSSEPPHTLRTEEARILL